MSLPRDDESTDIWAGLFSQAGVSTSIRELGTTERAATFGVGDARIALYDESNCWWSRSGPDPSAMPIGEPGGTDSEVFYRFDEVEHDPSFGRECHPHCDCGRYIEIGNSVFMQYRRTASGFENLPQRNVNFGGGLERLTMAALDAPDMFRIDLLFPLVAHLERRSRVRYGERPAPLRVIADHVRALVFLAANGVVPSNNEQGYVMRRFARPARCARVSRSASISTCSVHWSRPLSPLTTTPIPNSSSTRPSSSKCSSEKRPCSARPWRGRSRVPENRRARALRRRRLHALRLARVPARTQPRGSCSDPTPVDSAWRTRFDALMDEQRERSRSAAQGLLKAASQTIPRRRQSSTPQHTSSTRRCGSSLVITSSSVGATSPLSGSASTSHTLQRSPTSSLSRSSGS